MGLRLLVTMRRSIVHPLVIACAAAFVVCVLALAGPAGAAPRAPHIICPERAYVVPPCCPLPPGPELRRAHVLPICCGTAPCCAPGTCCTSGTCCTARSCGPGSLTIASSPNPSRAGQKVVISGTGTAGAQVRLWRKRAGQSTFQQVTTTTADGSGNYTFTLKRGTVMADQEWYVTSSGAQSSTVTQQVQAVVALASSTHSILVGHKIVLRGHVTPSHAGEVVLIEMSRGGAWQVIARPRLGHGSTYTVSHRFGRSGALRLRVVLRGDSRNEQSSSPTVTIKVRR